MLVSVVIPTFNRCGLLLCALSSVLSQSTGADEIIVIDDGSIDETERLMRLMGRRWSGDMPSFRYHRIEHCGYAGKVRNIGVQLARGRLVAFLDDDDLWEPTKLQRQLALHRHRPTLVLSHTAERWVNGGAVLAHTDIYCEDDQLPVAGMPQSVTVADSTYRAVSAEQFFDACLRKCVIGPSTVMVQRDTIATDGGFIGGFREDLKITEDYELWIRLCATLPVGYVAEPLTIKCAGGWRQLSKQHPFIEKFRIEALRGILDANLLSVSQTERAVRVLLHKVNIWCNGCIKRGRIGEAARYRALLEKYSVPTN